jgi:hypothetical protein
MQFIDDVSLPGHGNISGAFLSLDSRILIVTSAFRRLTEPPARASYGGHRLHYRAALYRVPSRRPLAVFDDARYPIRDVAFHPTRTMVVLGAGSYDGGYLFHGQLIVWDWTQAWSKSLRQIPEVVRVRFDQAGEDVEAIVRPWDDGAGHQQSHDPVNSYYRILLKGALDREWDKGTDEEVRRQMTTQRPMIGREIERMPGFRQPSHSPIDDIRRAFGITNLKQRSPIWDVAFVNSKCIGFVHDDCLLELGDLNGELKHSFTGDGHGAQIFRGHKPLVYAVQVDKSSVDHWNNRSAALMQLEDGHLNEIVSLPGCYAFTMNRDGAILGRRDRSFQSERVNAELDVILSPNSNKPSMCDLGQYDVFNHYLRADGAPCLFFVQGTPPDSPQVKYLCTVTTGGQINRLWPLLADSGDHASHAMECCFCYVDDAAGPGIIVSGRHYNPQLSPYSGFIYRRTLDGRELWRHPTTAGATTIRAIAGFGLLVVAFLDGNLALFRSENGAIIDQQPYRPEGCSGVVYSIDVDDTHLGFGAIYGRCALVPISQITTRLLSYTTA